MKPLYARVALIGIGLIGGSFALAARRAGLVGHVAGHARTEATRRTALRLGLVDSAHDSPEAAVEGADLVLLCVPVGAMAAIAVIFEQYLSVLQGSATITDLSQAGVLGGILLWLADRAANRRGAAESWTARDAIVMGLAQAIALIPGTSRSGITMTAARWLGFDRTQAARLALLMAVPVIVAAGGLETLGVIRNGDFELGAELVLGAALSCVAALGALAVMMRMFAASWTMLPFVIYRLALGGVLLVMAYSGTGA